MWIDAVAGEDAILKKGRERLSCDGAVLGYRVYGMGVAVLLIPFGERWYEVKDAYANGVSAAGQTP